MSDIVLEALKIVGFVRTNLHHNQRDLIEKLSQAEEMMKFTWLTMIQQNMAPMINGKREEEMLCGEINTAI
jgi:hypothetical protein